MKSTVISTGVDFILYSNKSIFLLFIRTQSGEHVNAMLSCELTALCHVLLCSPIGVQTSLNQTLA